jgi:hypothetical protein
MRVNRGSNLRGAPSANADLVEHLTEGERVVRLQDQVVLGYYPVRYGDIDGWIWWMNVEAIPPGEEPAAAGAQERSDASPDPSPAATRDDPQAEPPAP